MFSGLGKFASHTRNVAAGALILGTVAVAQADSGAPIETVTVTGTRIKSGNQESISPVATTTLEDIKTEGETNIEAVLRDMPEAFNGHSSSTNNNGNGNTTANLRNLGLQRTLVLVDGKRVVESDIGGTVDLDIIPPEMIERVDVLTGGASAVYGADAIAGVVNIILRKDFDGFRVDGQYGTYDAGDGSTWDTSVLAGTNFANGRGNVTAFAGFTDRHAVRRNDRPWAFPQLVSNGTELVPFRGTILPQGRDLNTGLMFSPNRELVPYDGSTFDRATNQFLIVPQKRVVLGFNGHYDVAPWVSLYFRAHFSQNNVERQTSISGITDLLNVNFGNPLLSDQERSILFSPGPHSPNDLASINLQKAWVTNGNDQEFNTYNEFETVVGANGPIGSHFTYDISAQYGETDWHQILTGDLSPSRLQQGLLVNPDGTCFDPSNACVPIDVFTGAPNAIDKSQLGFIRLTQQSNSVTTQTVIGGSVTGDLDGVGIRSPWSGQPVGVAAGAEYRRETSLYRPDDTLATGNNLVYGAIPFTAGSYRVAEEYVELRVPVVDDKPWAKSLELEGGFRHSDYNLAGPTNTYKYGGAWQPLSEIRFRGSFQHSVRAPNIGELFTPAQPNSTTAVDPCFSENGAPPTASHALCVATGVPSGAYGNPLLQCPSDNCKAFTGGNPALKVERSNSVTFGVAVTPDFIEGLTSSFDYFNITIKGAIAPFGTDGQTVLNNCYGTGPGQNPSQDPNNVFCQKIQRSPAGDLFTGGHNGSIGDISLLLANTGLLHTAGFDYSLDYARNLDELGLSQVPGSIAASAKVSYIGSFVTQGDLTQPKEECVGTFGLICGQPIPRWRVNAKVTYSPLDELGLTLRWRFLSGVVLDTDKFSGTDTDPPDHAIPAFSYFDLAATWQIKTSIAMRAGVTNLLDKDPPRLSRKYANAEIFGFSNTFPGTYDVGRTVFAGLTVDF